MDLNVNFLIMIGGETLVYSITKGALHMLTKHGKDGAYVHNIRWEDALIYAISDLLYNLQLLFFLPQHVKFYMINQ